MRITKLELKKPEHKIPRVVAYTRVSTSMEIQLHSLAAQVSYYTDLINKNKNWIYAGIYIDEGLTGTSIKHRKGFLDMMKDARNKKFDLILTKSISRFSRNTVDSLKSIRELKDLGIDVYFEKENIHTLSNDGELLLSLLSAFSQSESESISSNIKWSYKKKMAAGVIYRVSPPLGYDWKEGNLVINEQEANLVKRIFKEYLDGKSRYAIVKELRNENIVGKHNAYFSEAVIREILTNVTYTGDRLYQKYISFAIRKKKINLTDPQYLIEDSHPAIISKKDFEKVQKELKRRSKKFVVGESETNLYCGYCGKRFTQQINGNDKTRIYKCVTKAIYGEKTCDTRNVNIGEFKDLKLDPKKKYKVFNSYIEDEQGNIIQRDTKYIHGFRYSRKIKCAECGSTMLVSYPKKIQHDVYYLCKCKECSRPAKTVSIRELDQMNLSDRELLDDIKYLEAHEKTINIIYRNGGIKKWQRPLKLSNQYGLSKKNH